MEEKAPVQSTFTGLSGRDIRRRSVAVRKASQNTSVTNAEELRDSVNRLAPIHANRDRGSATSQSLSRLQAKVSSYSAFASVHKSNRVEKRREVSFSKKLWSFFLFVRSFVRSFVRVLVRSFVNQCQAMGQKKQTCSYIGTQCHSQSVRILVHESAAPTDSLFSCDDTSSTLEQGDLQDKKN